jgi:polysaccharide export outer membrane protein
MAARQPHPTLLVPILSVAALMLGAASCPSSSTLKSPPPIVPDTTLGPGDVIVIDVFNEEELENKVFQVASDGTIDYPLIDRLKVGGLKPEAVADLVTSRLVEGGFLLDPQVSVLVKEYHSKRIHVLGEVKKPGTFSYQEGMTVVQAVTLAGGFTPLAKERRVSVTREIEGKEEVFVVDVRKIISHQAPNVPLQAGDIIYVPERVF